VNDGPRRDGAERRPAEDDAPDQEYARTYAAGYEEGVRSALREVLGHASRGHTAAELRMLIEGRLARLSEEVEAKRRAMIAPPSRPSWGSLFRPPTATRPWVAPLGVPAPPPVPKIGPGRTVLVREERPARSLELLRDGAAAFPRVAFVSLHPPAVEGLGPERRVEIAVGEPGGGGGPPTPGEIGGQLRAPTEAAGGALVYVDALEYLATEHSLDVVQRFVHWLVGQVRDTGSALIVSFDPRALDAKDASRLERAFQSVL
jgi:hypothetical protein